MRDKEVALISEETPLLADLSVVDNISLILEYHKNLSVKMSRGIISKLLKKCNIEEIKDKKPHELNRKDIIMVKYLRAHVSDFKTIVVERPFSMLDNIDDIEAVFNMFDIFDIKNVEIVDLESNHYYEDKKCHIIK